jgi:hypothetical protein
MIKTLQNGYKNIGTLVYHIPETTGMSAGIK